MKKSIISVLGTLLILSACHLAPSPETSGELTISFGNAVNARTLMPDFDMNVSSYVINGAGPGGGSFIQTSAGAPVTVAKLSFGAWNIAVSARNAAGTSIGSGSAIAQVHTGQVSAVVVTVGPLPGTGSLNLQAGWIADDIQTPSISGSLNPAQGSAIPLVFSLGAGTASYSSSAIPNGYYSLALSLMDNGISVAGAVEVVRIISGQTTSGNYAFTNIHKPGGSVQVNISTELADPLAVALSGASSAMDPGSVENLSASVQDYVGNVVYVWYVNGASAATGSSFAFGPGLDSGVYRVDVIAFTADGSRAGSANTMIDINAINNDPPALMRIIRGATQWSQDQAGNWIRTVVWSEPNMAPPYDSWSAYAQDYTSIGGVKNSGYVSFLDNGFGVKFEAAQADSQMTAGYLVQDGTNWYSITDWDGANPQFIPESVSTGSGSVILSYGYWGYAAVKIVHGGHTIWLLFSAST